MPTHGTRPTTDRVRESVFASLTHYLGDFAEESVLDLFAGSGALGLEASSRGAKQVLLVDSGTAAVRAMRANISTLGLSGVAVRQANAFTVLDQLRAVPATVLPFTLVFMDPPYEVATEKLTALLAELQQPGVCTLAAIAVVERAARGDDFEWPVGWRELGRRRYSETVVHLGDLVAFAPVSSGKETP